jgi:CDP-diacylglycerol--glycerol-3-phosphate 3-phosphatidyltransferase
VIDELYKPAMDRFWDRIGRSVARTGLSPNAITTIGLALNAANAAAFVGHRNTVVFGIALALIELLDNVDGAVARVTGSSSRAGAFLDATTDRYKEILPFLAISVVTGLHVACFLAVTGSLMVSYSQARADAEARPASDGRRRLPDLFERLERVATLCAGLILAPFLPTDLAFGEGLLYWVVWFLAAGTHATAIQRMARGFRRLRE